MFGGAEVGRSNFSSGDGEGLPDSAASSAASLVSDGVLLAVAVVWLLSAGSSSVVQADSARGTARSSAIVAVLLMVMVLDSLWEWGGVVIGGVVIAGCLGVGTMIGDCGVLLLLNDA
ncbi:hypothetical protein BJF89_01215 [Corynebacterium sp. CNJ-954]|nr:hypothetical protein BJF89_01215 [Corynebacterium sp. CNJ-954]